MNVVKLLVFISLLQLVACSSTPPKILIIGDSISIGYTPYVKEMLEGQAKVFHNQGNAQHTGTGLKMLEEWIGEEDWDIVQFNWGLWDLCYRHDSSKVQGKRDKVNGTITYGPEEYGDNLDSLVDMMRTLTKAKLLFVNTSYVPQGEAGRYEEDAVKYNRVAQGVMKRNNIPVNDIYQHTKTIHKEHATVPDNVHFTESGYEEIAAKIVEALVKLDRKIKLSN